MDQISPLLQKMIAQQKTVGISNKNNTNNYVNLTQKPDTFESSTKKDAKSNKTKTAKMIAIGITITAAAAGLFYAAKKGKSINLKDMTPDKFKQIKADKFTGTIKGELKNGDKIIMEYVDGAIKKSTRSGEVNFEKVYETINNEKIVKKTVNGITSESNITKIQEAVKASGEKLNKILNDKTLSSEELKKQSDGIKYISENQKREIEAAIKNKKNYEAEIKTKFQAEAAKTSKSQTEAAKKVSAEAAKTTSEEAAKEAKTQAEAGIKAKSQAEAAKKAAEETADVNFIDLSKIKQNKPYQTSNYTTKTRYEDIIENSTTKPDFSAEKEYLEKLKSVSVDESSKLGDYTTKQYDMPLKFMASTNEQFVKNGSGLIVDEVPEMFKGIEQNELARAIDNLGNVLDTKKINKFEIAGKKYTAEFKGSGQIGKVFKISDEQGHSVAVKYFKDPHLTGLQGAYAEIPIAREASKEGVIDVAKFYMANPCGRFDTIDGSFPNMNTGGWHMVEFIDDKMPLKNNRKGIKFFDWLKSHGLSFGDLNSGTYKGEYVVDIGGVMHPNNSYDPHFIAKRNNFAEELLLGYINNETINDIIKVISR